MFFTQTQCIYHAGVANSGSRLVSAATMGALPKLEVFSQEAANFVEQMRKSASQFVHPASATVAPVSAPARDLIDAVDTMLNDLKGQQISVIFCKEKKTERTVSFHNQKSDPLSERFCPSYTHKHTYRSRSFGEWSKGSGTIG
jgi:predicted GNAT family acetyltransferase